MGVHVPIALCVCALQRCMLQCRSWQNIFENQALRWLVRFERIEVELICPLEVCNIDGRHGWTSGILERKKVEYGWPREMSDNSV
jgi:hypothetical protein